MRPRHQDTIRDQFTRQAVPFSQAPSIRDEAALQLLVEACGARATEIALDVACGPGLVVCAFARAAAHAAGIDATPAMIARARSLQAERRLGNVAWYVGDASRLPFAAGAFDVVTCRFAFHHFERPASVLAEMVRACRPGGAVLVCDALASDDPAKAAAFNAMERLRDPSTVRFLALAELQELFAAAGLPAPEPRFYRVPAELEGLMQVSFPAEGDGEAVRRMIIDSVAGDSLGMATRLDGARYKFAYPAVVLVARKPA
jgi:ubiquinone/menaquinone biosynthesis C-methylase UbiE